MMVIAVWVPLASLLWGRPLLEEMFELRLVGASLEKALEKGVLGREKGRVRKLKCTNLENERRQVGGVGLETPGCGQ